MRNINEFKSREEWEKHLWDIFLKSVEKSKSEKQLVFFLNNLLSKDEKKNIIRRLTTISLLKQGKTYREIGEILWISPGTISAIKKSIRNSAILKNYHSKYSFYKDKKIANIKNTKGSSSQTIFDYWADYSWLPPMGKGRWKFLNIK